jgi:hypothetical protein
MKKPWTGVFVAGVFATTAVLGAQGNPSPANTPPGDAQSPPGIQKPSTPAPSSQARPNTVTISGCIQDVPMATAGAATTPASPGATRSYYLNNAMMADAGRERPAVGTAGLTATGYRLEGDNALITPHLNHQVRITGTVQASNASSTGAASAAPGSTAAGPVLKVDSVTMVSAKCEVAK